MRFVFVFLFTALLWVWLPGASQAQQQASTKPPAEGAAKPAAAPSSEPQGQISESQLAGLPLNGRSYSQLATLQAGVSDSSAGSSSRGVGGGSLTVAGSRS